VLKSKLKVLLNGRYVLAYLKREGKSQPANNQRRALGDISPGLPLKRASWTSLELIGHEREVNC
jgi:hypothetical protein